MIFRSVSVSSLLLMIVLLVPAVGGNAAGNRSPDRIDEAFQVAGMLAYLDQGRVIHTPIGPDSLMSATVRPYLYAMGDLIIECTDKPRQIGDSIDYALSAVRSHGISITRLQIMRQIDTSMTTGHYARSLPKLSTGHLCRSVITGWVLAKTTARSANYPFANPAGVAKVWQQSINRGYDPAARCLVVTAYLVRCPYNFKTSGVVVHHVLDVSKAGPHRLRVASGPGDERPLVPTVTHTLPSKDPLWDSV